MIYDSLLCLLLTKRNAYGLVFNHFVGLYDLWITWIVALGVNKDWKCYLILDKCI